MRRFATLVLVAAAVVLSTAVFAQKVKEPKSSLDNLVIVRPELRVSETVADSETIRDLIPNAKDMDLFRAENGAEWKFIIDQRRGRPALLEGGAIPFLPGQANGLRWDSFAAPGCVSYWCIPKEQVAKLAYDFMIRYKDLLGVDPNELELDPEGSVPIGDSIYFLRFQWKYAGIPVEGASVFFRINNGNLIQVATEKIGDISLDPIPTLTRGTAWDILGGYLGFNVPDGKDEVLNRGSLIIVPVTPVGQDANVYSGAYGKMADYKLAYRLAFRRPGIMGTWEALVDAHTGDILRFVDANKYGHIQGGVYKTDKAPTQTEVTMPFPYADYGSGTYADIVGDFAGTSGTCTMTGRTGSAGNVGGVKIVDTCGSVSQASDGTGLLDFGSSTGTDCTTPGHGGAGNTHAARTQYWNVSQIKIKAYTYLPTNTWLQGQLTDNVNLNQTCNAYWDGTSLNFFYQGPGGCANTGELPGVSLHEWGHGMDDNDGSGGGSPPLETRADWTAILQTHQSCAGGGFFLSGNCSGYGDACLNCSGIRDADRMQHTHTTPWTPANNGQADPGYSCSGGSYNGPCGWEDHCESGIASQALWELVNTDLPALCGLDTVTAWQLDDRLWYTGMPTLTNMYTCTPPTSNGCAGGSLYTVMRAIDDDGDGTANGTPHAAAIFAALNRHNIACGAVGDATNQNHTSCPALTISTLSGTAGSNQAHLSWGAVTNATRYFVFRNDTSCTAGFTKIATVAAPTVTYDDNNGYNGMTSYYRIQAATANDSCVSAMSNCVSVTPQPCAASITLNQTVYTCSSTVGVTVLDSTPGTGPWSGQAWSTSDATPRTFALTGAAPNLTGSFTTTTGAGGAGVVHVANGDTLTVRFVDPDYCGTPNQNVDTTATIDCVGPVISNVLATNVTDSGATITWTTNESANSRVTYGTSSPPGTNKDDLITYVTSHSVTLTGLATCTTYGFSVTSVDAAGNSTTDTNGGAYYPFTTSGRYFAFGPDHVESGAGSWVASGTAGSIWHIDTCRADSATHAWKAGASDAPTCTAQYGDSVTTDLTSGVIALGSTGHGLHLRWNEWYSTESGYDYCLPQISTDGGTTWTDLVTHYSGASTGWGARDMDLAAYTGSNVKIRFHFTSDTSVTYEGWYVDDIEVSKSQACGPALAQQSHSFTDVCNGTGTGSGDGIVDPGEDIALQVTLFNGGSSGATGVSAIISTATAGITVTDNYATFPDIAAGATGASQPNHYSFRVDPSVACGTVISFSIHMVSNEKPAGWDDSFTVTVGSVAQGNTTPINEAFTTGDPPAGWTRVNGGTGTQQWTTTNPGGRTAPAGITAPFEIIDSDYDGSGKTQDDSLITPAFSCASATSVTLTFDTYFKWNSSSDFAYIDVSNDGGATWQNKATWTADVGSSTTASHQVMDITTLAGTSANVKVRFRYVGSYGWYWLVDNVKVDITAPGGCTVHVCTPTPPPTAPTNLQSSPTKVTAVTLTWTDNASNETGFKVERKTGAAGTWSQVGTTAANVATYVDNGTVQNTLYYYRVRAYNGSGDSAYSNESPVTTYTRGMLSLSAPMSLAVGQNLTLAIRANTGSFSDVTTVAAYFDFPPSAFSATTSTVNLSGASWPMSFRNIVTNSTGHVELSVSNSTPQGGSNLLVGTLVLTALQPGEFQIALDNNNIVMLLSDVDNTNIIQPAVPIQVSVIPLEVAPGDSPATAQGWTGKTTHTWPSAAGATGYKVYRGLLADLPNLLNSSTDSCTKWTGAATSCTVNDDPSGIAGGFYWYLVTGTNAGGEGSAGNATAGPRTVNSSGTCP
jgi:hypothetical protein